MNELLKIKRNNVNGNNLNRTICQRNTIYGGD